MTAHKDIEFINNHTPYRWVFDTITERLAYTTSDTSELYKKALQLDNESEHILVSLTPIRWKELGATQFVPVVISSRLNASPERTLSVTTPVVPDYPLILINTAAPTTIIITPSIVPPPYNSTELTLLYIGATSITFQGEGDLAGTGIDNTFTLDSTNRIQKLIFNTTLNLWITY